MRTTYFENRLFVKNANGTLSGIPYAELPINNRINAKGNAENKGKAYGTRPLNWGAMFCMWVWDGFTPVNDGIYNYSR